MGRGGLLSQQAQPLRSFEQGINTSYHKDGTALCVISQRSMLGLSRRTNSTVMGNGNNRTIVVAQCFTDNLFRDHIQV